jgi:AraC-like DNA-binding protein
MNALKTRLELEHTLSSALTEESDFQLTATNDIGQFNCIVRDFGDFSITERNFKTYDKPLDIPFTCRDPGLQMVFSLDGQSVFNTRMKPYILRPTSHTLNYFNYLECRNLLDEQARQHDITFRVRKNFYHDIITSHLAIAEDPLPYMIYNQEEFNTVNQHLPTDSGIEGILINILTCPHKGPMRTLFIREHLRALLILQLFHFQKIVTGKAVIRDEKLSKQDKQVLEAIKEYIDLNFLEPASLEGLSRQFGINEFKIKYGFKTLFNVSPIRYLQHKRLLFALFLLRNTDKSIKEIADEIGYTHAANFTAAFSKAFGNSPNHYRPVKQQGIAVS